MHTASNRHAAGRRQTALRPARRRGKRRQAAFEQALTAVLSLLLVMCLAGVGYKIWLRIAALRNIDALRAQLSAPTPVVVTIACKTTPVPAAVPVRAVSSERLEPTPTPPCAEAAARMSNLASLQQTNGELFGWLAMEGTRIDYPVMYSPLQPRFYLSRDFEGADSKCGLPFIDESCDPYQSRANLLIHAHNMKDGSMFAGLTKLIDETYYQAHRTLTLETPEQTMQYRLIAVVPTEITEEAPFKYYLYGRIDSAHDFDAYVRLVRNGSLYPLDTDVQWGDELLSLSTCAYHADFGRLVAVAKRVS